MTDLFPGAKLMQVMEWGYPRGSLRPVPPADKAYSVVHITANLATAENEAAWRIRDPALQNSATFFVNRDGSVVQLLGDPLRMDPWANGAVRSPDLSNPRIAAMVRDGVNANERTLVAIENVGNEYAWGSVPGGHPITPAQEATSARIIAYYHAKAKVPITRETVIGHYQIDGQQRANCPSRDKSILNRIVALATQEADMPVITKTVREQWDIPAETPLYTGGPEMGERRTFPVDNRLWSNGETTDGRWRRVEGVGPTQGQEFYVRRIDMTVVPGTRNPKVGFGPPDIEGFDPDQLAAAERNAFIDGRDGAVVKVLAGVEAAKTITPKET